MTVDNPFDSFIELGFDVSDFFCALVFAAKLNPKGLLACVDTTRLKASVLCTSRPVPIVGRPCRRWSIQKEGRLIEFRFQCHRPNLGTAAKTATGTVANGHDFGGKVQG